ncbi:hypothetical protein OsJ_20700 [Oryza sativa Japonica Group]|uniref:Uncharacterized protein n=1 Tax=Oryza sativa subsp. japonica TaxID=39947 RepID=Q67UL8_ORYSJ|nr:hypothetical protein OsJ_20700 [Oryza sativa Japonica Group]BAD38151.1 hypothetical protein [Oryza sativa Japonica Group]
MAAQAVAASRLVSSCGPCWLDVAVESSGAAPEEICRARSRLHFQDRARFQGKRRNITKLRGMAVEDDGLAVDGAHGRVARRQRQAKAVGMETGSESAPVAWAKQAYG